MGYDKDLYNDVLGLAQLVSFNQQLLRLVCEKLEIDLSTLEKPEEENAE